MVTHEAYQVTAQISGTLRGWHSSRQLPTVTIMATDAIDATQRVAELAFAAAGELEDRRISAGVICLASDAYYSVQGDIRDGGRPYFLNRK